MSTIDILIDNWEDSDDADVLNVDESFEELEQSLITLLSETDRYDYDKSVIILDDFSVQSECTDSVMIIDPPSIQCDVVPIRRKTNDQITSSADDPKRSIRKKALKRPITDLSVPYESAKNEEKLCPEIKRASYRVEHTEITELNSTVKQTFLVDNPKYDTQSIHCNKENLKTTAVTSSLTTKGLKASHVNLIRSRKQRRYHSENINNKNTSVQHLSKKSKSLDCDQNTMDTNSHSVKVGNFSKTKLINVNRIDLPNNSATDKKQDESKREKMASTIIVAVEPTLSSSPNTIVSLPNNYATDKKRDESKREIMASRMIVAVEPTLSSSPNTIVSLTINTNPKESNIVPNPSLCISDDKSVLEIPSNATPVILNLNEILVCSESRDLEHTVDETPDAQAKLSCYKLDAHDKDLSPPFNSDICNICNKSLSQCSCEKPPPFASRTNILSSDDVFLTPLKKLEKNDFQTPALTSKTFLFSSTPLISKTSTPVQNDRFSDISLIETSFQQDDEQQIPCEAPVNNEDNELYELSFDSWLRKDAVIDAVNQISMSRDQNAASSGDVLKSEEDENNHIDEELEATLWEFNIETLRAISKKDSTVLTKISDVNILSSDVVQNNINEGIAQSSIIENSGKSAEYDSCKNINSVPVSTFEIIDRKPTILGSDTNISDKYIVESTQKLIDIQNATEDNKGKSGITNSLDLTTTNKKIKKEVDLVCCDVIHEKEDVMIKTLLCQNSSNDKDVITFKENTKTEKRVNNVLGVTIQSDSAKIAKLQEQIEQTRKVSAEQPVISLKKPENVLSNKNEQNSNKLNKKVADSKPSTEVNDNNQFKAKCVSESKLAIDEKSEGGNALAASAAEKPKIVLHPEENKDIEHPDWDKVKRLETDDQRYKEVRSRWQLPRIPDPNKDLTFHSFRRKRLFKQSKFKHSPIRLPGNIRKRPAGDSNENPSSKKARTKSASCTYLIDSKIHHLKEEFKQMSQFSMHQYESQVHNLEREQWNIRQQPRVPIDDHYRQYYNYPFYDSYVNALSSTACHMMMMQNEAKRDRLRFEHEARVNQARLDHDMRLKSLISAREEITKFCAFYKGLGGKSDKNDPTIVTESQMLELNEIENVYNCFENHYFNPNK